MEVTELYEGNSYVHLQKPLCFMANKMKLCFLQLFRSMTGVVDPITGGSRSAGGGDQGAWGCPQNDWRLHFGSLA